MARIRGFEAYLLIVGMFVIVPLAIVTIVDIQTVDLKWEDFVAKQAERVECIDGVRVKE